MKIIEYLFGAGASTIILILIFFPTIAFIIQFIANIQIIKKLPRIENNLELMNERLLSIENFSMPQDIKLKIENNKKEKNKTEEMLENLEYYENNEEYKLEIKKEEIEYIILIILMMIIVTLATLRLTK